MNLMPCVLPVLAIKVCAVAELAHLRATPCGEGVVSRPAVEPTAALCFTVSYDEPPRLQEVLHHVVGCVEIKFQMPTPSTLRIT